MKTDVFLLIVVAFFILSASFFIFKDGASQTPRNANAYCSSDGTLTDTMPIQSHRSYCIKPDAAGKTYSPNTSNEYSFSILDDQGNILKDFEVEHEKLLHLIVVREDLGVFQHLHPNFNETSGQFTLSDLTFPTPGEYRIFADFTPRDAQKGPEGTPLSVAASTDVRVAGNYTPQPLGSTERNKTFEGYSVVLSSDPVEPVVGADMLSFTIKKDGKPVTDLEGYLGALGHSVILEEETLEYIHTHALEEPGAVQNGTINFHVQFPSAGSYAVFTQFQHGGKVVTADFVISVSEPGNTMLPGMQINHAY